MTTHAGHTVEFSAPCEDGHPATWRASPDGQPVTVRCGTCDPPPEPRPDRYLRDVDAHLRRRA